VKYQLFPYLIEKFQEFNTKYDSKLFEQGILEKDGAFSDDILHKVIRGLYFGTTSAEKDRYRFDQIPGDLLGSIYEQYLGHVLKESDKRVKLQNGQGKRKSMGIYYTPAYIVEYIVKNTVGEYIKDKPVDEILNVKICDPACGSGSFIIRAFQEVCNIIEEKLKKGQFASKWAAFKNYDTRLKLSQKITILTNCIYGVDLDEKAVELARLNLLLKLLEEEGQETKKLLLPHLESNIKCGNSLIDDNTISDKAFNWKAQFPEVFKQEGFDVIVGNPPYGAELKEDEKNWLKKKFDKDKTGNTASFFIFLGDLILKEKGNLSFIVPKQLTYTSSWSGTRKLLLEEDLMYVIDSSEAFADVELEQIIFICKKQRKEDKRIIVGFSNKGEIIENNSNINYFSEQRFPLWITNENYSIFEKILKNSTPLKEIAKVNWGGLVAKYLTKNKTADAIPCLRGREVQRYYATSEYFIKKKDIDQAYYVKGEKLIFQRIVCRYGEKIIANYRNARIVGTYANDDNYADKTVTMIWDSKVNLKFLLALFNSKLINWFAHRYLWNRSQLTMEFMYEYARNFPLHYI
jgi:type I restriction-modification system DNA methylase subunit